MNCKNCGTEIYQNVSFCPACGESVTEAESNALGMKWYKLQAYFIMPFSALVNSFIGISLIPGVLSKMVTLYADTKIIPKDIISIAFFLDSHREAHMILAFIEIALAIYYAYVSFAMIEYKKTAPMHIYISQVLSQAVGLVYFIVMIILTRNFDTEMLLTLAKNMISGVISVVFWITVYTKYYNKRKHLFIK